MSTPTLDRLKAVFETMGIACEQIGEIIALSTSKLRFNAHIHQDKNTQNFFMQLHFCGAQTAYMTHSICIASGEADVDKALDVMFERFCSCQIPVILESLTELVSERQCSQDEWPGLQQNFQATIGNLNLFGTDRDIDLAAIYAHIGRLKQFVGLANRSEQAPIFCFDTTLCSFDGAITACDLHVNNRPHAALSDALRSSYQPKPVADLAIVRHLAIAKQSASIVRDARVRLIEAVLAWCKGERTADNFGQQLKAHEFNAFESKALAVLVPETLAMAWFKQKGLETVIFRVTDRFEQSHTLLPDKHPIFQLALDFAAEAFESPAMLDFKNEYHQLASMSGVMDGATKTLERSADLSGSVIAVALLAPSAEEFGLGLEGPPVMPPVMPPAKPKPWWKRW
jgi:hypothetical protein